MKDSTMINTFKDLRIVEKIKFDTNMSDDHQLTKHKDLVDWYDISQYQKLSEEFITNHKDLIYWI